MRILVAGFQHETNTFAERCADWPAFQSGEFFPAFAAGKGFLLAGRHVGLPIAGFVQAAHAACDEVIESCWAGAAPSGPLTAEAFESICHRIVTDAGSALRTASLNAVYLDLHGAAVAHGCESPEVALLSALRAVIGSDVPVVVSLDSHANVDARLLSLADYATCYLCGNWRQHAHEHCQCGSKLGEVNCALPAYPGLARSLGASLQRGSSTRSCRSPRYGCRLP